MEEKRIATDCRDIRGTLIYTGDYICLDDDVKRIFDVEDGIVHFVRGMFVVGDGGYRHSFDALASWDYVMRGEVIGNIYDNPEILEYKR